MRFSYDQMMTVEGYEEAIAEAYGQAEGLYERSERLAAEAERWEDRARVLEMELSEFEIKEYNKNV
jgi:hypothetical protein